MSTTPADASSSGLTRAHVMPLAVFMGFLLLRDALGYFGLTNASESAPWWQRQPELWLYPLQTLVTLAVLASCRKHWHLRPLRGAGLAVLLGILGIAIWIAPGFLARSLNLNLPVLSYFGLKSRTHGFDPGLLLDSGSGLYWAVIALRFLRLVVVVPLAEELFWRGFLMRHGNEENRCLAARWRVARVPAGVSGLLDAGRHSGRTARESQGPLFRAERWHDRRGSPC